MVQIINLKVNKKEWDHEIMSNSIITIRVLWLLTKHVYYAKYVLENEI